jgi:hypothetical protein
MVGIVPEKRKRFCKGVVIVLVALVELRSSTLQ